MFPYQREKAAQVASWFLDRHGGSLPLLKLMNLVFLADRGHLARHGRPIVGGPYVAMSHGPMASRLYDDLNRGAVPIGFLRRDGEEVRRSDMLSESDLEILVETDLRYGGLDVITLRKMAHETKAWRKNFDEGEPDGSRLPYEDFFEDLDESSRGMLDVIHEDQISWAVLLGDEVRGHYSLIQYCPDLSRLEAVNVGVVLLCPDFSPAMVRMTKDDDEPRRVFGRAVDLGAAKESLANRLGKIRFLGDLERFAETRANELLLTAPRPVKVMDPTRGIDGLFDELVSRQLPKDQTDSRHNK